MAETLTLKDVASAAGVSVSAVSQAINGTGSLHEDTRERILGVVAELGYTPNRYAASLRRRQTMSIGFVTTTGQSSETEKRWANFFSQQLNSLVSAAAEHGYTVTVIPDSRADLIAIARVDALYFPENYQDEKILAEAIKRGLVVVTNDTPLEYERSINVQCGYGQATEIALNALLAGGARRIGLLTEDPGVASDELGEFTYRQWCAENSVEPVVEYIDYGRTNFAAQLEKLLSRGVDAIYSYAEEGPAIKAALSASGRGIPDEVQLVALCLDDCAENEQAGVSRVCVHPELAPAQVIHALVALAEKGAVDAREATLPVDCATGTTTRAKLVSV
jgi:DNA-binding LacI/PurR family transcriptional regulator